jgi:hypothetical protein
VTLDEGEFFIMRPIMAGLCQMESAYNGALDLEKFALMNDALDVRDENERRYRVANKKD